MTGLWYHRTPIFDLCKDPANRLVFVPPSGSADPTADACHDPSSPYFAAHNVAIWMGEERAFLVHTGERLPIKKAFTDVFKNSSKERWNHVYLLGGVGVAEDALPLDSRAWPPNRTTLASWSRVPAPAPVHRSAPAPAVAPAPVVASTSEPVVQGALRVRLSVPCLPSERTADSRLFPPAEAATTVPDPDVLVTDVVYKGFRKHLKLCKAGIRAGKRNAMYVHEHTGKKHRTRAEIDRAELGLPAKSRTIRKRTERAPGRKVPAPALFDMPANVAMDLDLDLDAELKDAFADPLWADLMLSPSKAGPIAA